MGSQIQFTAADGRNLTGYEARAGGEPRCGVVVVQEIFGVTAHIRDVVDAFAAAGYHALAPAMFDRLEPGVVLPYTDIDGGRALVARLSRQDVLADVGGAVAHLAGSGRVGVVGYCWGGTVTWLAAARVPGPACAVPYYGGQMGKYIEETPRCPVMGHFGEQDTMPAPEQIRALVEAHASVTAHFYPAGHGFNCDQRGSFDAESAKLARSRTLAFLAKQVG